MGEKQCLKKGCLRISKIDKRHQAEIWENYKLQQDKHKEHQTQVCQGRITENQRQRENARSSQGKEDMIFKEAKMKF